MSVSDAQQRDGRHRRVGGPVFDLIPSKLHRPVPRPGIVPRSSLIEQLAKGNLCPVVSVVAPPGYGKSTLLSQWAERKGQAFAWVSVDEGDNDPKVLLAYVAAALDAVEPINERVFDALASPASSVPGAVIPRLSSAFWSMTTPVVLILDDVHLVHNREGQAALSMLAEHVPEDSRLVLAGRARPPLRIARLRAEGRIFEIGPSDLSLTVDEAASLLRAAEVVLGDDELAELYRRTEGWPVGLYLAALCLREGGSLGAAAAAFGGADRFVSEYVETELLARISKQQQVFLTQTAALERMCGSLCEAVLELPGSAATLAELARSNLLLVPSDRYGEWYRYHNLFREMLQAELHRQEPGLAPVLQRRAANWCLQHDLPEEALEYFMTAGDVDAAAQLMEKLWDPAYREGRMAIRERWIQWLADQGGIGRYPPLAASASFYAADVGRPREAEHWADVVDRWQYGDPARPGNPPAEGRAATLRAWLCRRGVEQMRADADEAARKLAPQNNVSSEVMLAQGLARVFCGNPEGGSKFLEDAISRGDADAPDVLALALCELSLLAMTRSEWGQAEAFASRARSALRGTGMEDSYATPMVCAVQARAAVHGGDAATAHGHLVSAQRLRHLLTYAYPYMAVQARIELTRVHLALADLAGARTLIREIDELLKRRPGLGTLVGEAAALRAQLAGQQQTGAPGASSLTAAELRLLPLLATHLTFPEISQELFLSRNTIKSHVQTIYRKLGADSRGQAVAQAREAGLLEG
jgi:LuxR family transcriptional regulator, maltose regulon positive regulatory protein